MPPPLPPRPSKENVELAKVRANLRETKTRETKKRELKLVELRPIKNKGINGYTYPSKDLDINFYDMDAIEIVIMRAVKDAKNRGLTNEASFHVKFGYITDADDSKFYKWKTFNSVKLKDIDELFRDIYLYNEQNLEASANGYERIIQNMTIQVIQEDGGGCNLSGSDKKHKTDEGIHINPRSKDNNCFFYVVKDILNLPLKGKSKLNKKVCNDIRQEFKLEHNSYIPLSIGYEILKKYCIEGKYFELTDATTKQTLKNFDDPAINADVLCYLLKGHYISFIKRSKNKCPNCLKSYFNNHKCSNKRISYVRAKLGKKDRKCFCLLGLKKLSIIIKMKYFIMI